jgi:enoyl-CoA hydratase
VIELDDKLMLYEKDSAKKIAWLTFNRPERHNTFRMSEMAKITEVIRDVDGDDEVKVLVIRGEGPSFCAGSDRDEIMELARKQLERPPQREWLTRDHNVIYGLGGKFQSILRCLKATICEAHGYCYGAGMFMALTCDITIAAPDATFTNPGWRHTGPSLDAFLPLWFTTIGVKRTKEMMLVGKPLTAEEALGYGLINRVVPREELRRTVDTYAEAIAQLPMDGIVMGKAALEEALDQVGVGLGALSGVMRHTWSTNIRAGGPLGLPE